MVRSWAEAHSKIDYLTAADRESERMCLVGKAN